MRLVIDGRRLTRERTGVGRCLESLLAEWSVIGLPCAQTLLLLHDRGGLSRVPRVEGLTTRVVREGWPGLAWEQFGLASELRAGDLLFAPANLIPWSWHGRTVVVIYDTLPWVVPESFPRLVRWRFGWRYRMAARRASRILAPSEATARDIARFHQVPRERIRVTYPAPEPMFQPMPADAPQVIDARNHVGLESAAQSYYLFVGKRSGRRNVPAILEGFARHRAEHPRSRLVFVGPDDPGPLPGPSEGTLRAGHVPEPVLHGLLAGALALLYPSDYEGFGLPIVEAMASGCPVITLRNSALIEAGGEAPWYLESADAPSITHALNTLATNASTREQLIAKGFEQVARFSRRRFAEEVKEELNRALLEDQPIA